MRLPAVLLLSACSSTSTGIEAQEWDYRDEPFTPPLTEVYFGVGQQDLHESLRPNDDATAFWFDYQEGDRIGPLALEGGVHWSRDRSRTFTGTQLTVDVLEISAGLRLSGQDWGWKLAPYVGGGGSLVFLGLEREIGSEVEDDDDVDFGGYLKAGVLVQLRPNSFIGFELRELRTGLFDLHGGTVRADSLTFGLVFGARF